MDQLGVRTATKKNLLLNLLHIFINPIKQRRCLLATVSCGLLILISFYSYAFAAVTVSEQNLAIEDVAKAFDDLTHHGEWMGYHNGPEEGDRAPIRKDLYSPSHIQGIVRAPGPGAPYFFVACSSEFPDVGGSDANLVVVKMGSRGTSGERLRSNRLVHDEQTSCSLPENEDQVVVNITYPNYRHPGGMQMIGDILIVPLEGARENTGFCDGGNNHGDFCDSDTDCHTVCTEKEKVCEGGAYTGNPCATIADCGSDGSCVDKGICGGGMNEGIVCGEDADCPASSGTCRLAGVCRGGLNKGSDCVGDGSDECPDNIGYCISSLCQGGPEPGKACTIDTQCQESGACYALPENRLVFYDMSNPENPKKLAYQLDIEHGAGAVGIAKLRGDGRFLMAIAWGWGDEVKFYRSNKSSFLEPDFEFELVDTWYPPNIEDPLTKEDCSITKDNPWPVCNNTFQNLSFVTQTDNRLFMIAGRNTNALAQIVPGEDELTLFEIKGFDSIDNLDIQLEWKSKRTFTFRNDNSFVDYDPVSWYQPLSYEFCSTDPLVEVTNADLLAGGSTYISPSGELLFYAVTHYNDGQEGKHGDPITRFVELRHQHVVNENSPTKELVVDPGGPYVVNEGDVIKLDGIGSHPKLDLPWVQLFEDTSFEGQSIMLDYADRGKDDYHDFGELDGEAALWPCLDLAELAEVTAEGKGLVYEDTFGLTLNSFTTKTCVVSWKDGKCWLKEPTAGVKGTVLRQCFMDSLGITPGIVLNGECWILPPTAEVKGHKICVSGFCGPCSPALLGESKNCTLVNSFGGEKGHWKNICYADPIGLVPGVVLNGECYTVVPTPGIPGLEVPIPDFNSAGWTLVPRFFTLLGKLPGVIDKFGNCGRLLGDDVREPPQLPNLVNVLNPAEYDKNGDGKPDAIQDLKGFVDLFPTFGEDVTDAIAELETYAGDLEDYMDQLITSIHGFNDRASSVRWYAPTGTDIVLHDQENYQGAKLVLQGTGTVGENFNLGSSKLTNPDGTQGHAANDRIRSIGIDGPQLDINPALTYDWQITSPMPAADLMLIAADTQTPEISATESDGPDEVTVELAVTDDNGGVAIASTNVKVLNVAPKVSISRIEDKNGPLSGETPAQLMVGTKYKLFASFQDPGIADIHTAAISWGDGIENTTDNAANQFDQNAIQLTEPIHTEPGTVMGSHMYVFPGSDPIWLTVEDDDSGITTIKYPVEIVEIPGTIEERLSDIIEALSNLTGANKKSNKLLGRALKLLEGKRGALYYFERNRPHLAMRKILRSVILMQWAERVDESLDLDELMARLSLITRVTTVTRVSEAEESTRGGWGHWVRLMKANLIVGYGDERLSSGRYVLAVRNYITAFNLVGFQKYPRWRGDD